MLAHILLDPTAVLVALIAATPAAAAVLVAVLNRRAIKTNNDLSIGQAVNEIHTQTSKAKKEAENTEYIRRVVDAQNKLIKDLSDAFTEHLSIHTPIDTWVRHKMEEESRRGERR